MAISLIKKGFSLVELVIVVAVLGIMAAIVVPQFNSYSVQAKEAVVKDDLRILRGAIELYTGHNKGIPPGYPDNNPLNAPDYATFCNQLMVSGKFLKEVPDNPFNNLAEIKMLGNNENFPETSIAGYGWIYQPATMKIKLNYSGSDLDGVRYMDY
jgi:prepilin-type N-terminal cleavage/methylation domain-containing protein